MATREYIEWMLILQALSGQGTRTVSSKILAEPGYRLENLRRPIFVTKKGILFIFCILLPQNCYAQNNSFYLGYGFGITKLGKIEGDRSYNFFQAAYSHEFPIIKDFFLVGEPFLAFLNEPEKGMDIGLGLFFRYYLKDLFFSLGGGGAYTSVHFQEQTHHYLFILQGGIGYKWKNFFIEDRFRHYSNAGLASPNHSINANILSIGILF